MGSVRRADAGPSRETRTAPSFDGPGDLLDLRFRTLIPVSYTHLTLPTKA